MEAIPVETALLRDLVVLGPQGAYEARCRVCYDPTEPEQPELDLVTG